MIGDGIKIRQRFQQQMRELQSVMEQNLRERSQTLRLLLRSAGIVV